MIKIAEQKDLAAILAYLKKHVENCLYMYIDIAKYGLDNPNMKVWLDCDGDGINMVVMKYHDSISVYAEDSGFPVDDAVGLIRSCAVGSVTARKDIIERLSIPLSDIYGAEYGYVFSYQEFPEYNCDAQIIRAEESDMLDIARLIVSDEGIGSYYQVEDLAGQFKERARAGFGRNYIIYADGKIAAHYGTYAEFENIAVIAGLIVDPGYRGRHFGGALESHIVKTLLGEGFRVYSFATTQMRYQFLTKHGIFPVGEYGKLVRT